jgi:hypothetical protein
MAQKHKVINGVFGRLNKANVYSIAPLKPQVSILSVIMVTYSFFFVPFFLKVLGFLPAVIGSQVILQGEEYLLKNNNNFISTCRINILYIHRHKT